MDEDGVGLYLAFSRPLGFIAWTMIEGNLRDLMLTWTQVRFPRSKKRRIQRKWGVLNEYTKTRFWERREVPWTLKVSGELGELTFPNARIVSVREKTKDGACIDLLVPPVSERTRLPLAWR